MEWLLLLIIGLLAGTIGSVMGLGGGIIVVPALLLFSHSIAILHGVTPQVAVGTSLLIMIFTGLSSTLAYIKQKKVDVKSGLFFLCGSIPGAFVGVFINKGIQVDDFLLYFGLFIIFISFVFLVRDKLKPIQSKRHMMMREYINEQNEKIQYGYHPLLALSISFLVGMLSGLFGIGGGSLMVPAMILMFGFPPHLAVATSMFMIFFSAIASSVSHIFLGNVNWLLALTLIPGAWLGGALGAYINAKIKSDTLVLLLRIFLIFIGIRLVMQGF
ncbi:sulfite exporter TauE/SafE family protein [Alkalihalobacillus sp. LMS39]|uniref:sulfite exporter TauE/SafE family protein n=1 Tax=Alkalihalobacillus sp. LMS39 TaxID=2924032 RepID=UPI001FB2F33B|nr:sulfite exporter TauE/SafE family protein [Alkalihalobacillus sp. LMS39]UOE93675.1 sulfite exporter TauE/SafE family protein [Alkalihalobacillus sp. LMS39]